MKGLEPRGSLASWWLPTIIPKGSGRRLALPWPQGRLTSLAFPGSPRLCSFSSLALESSGDVSSLFPRALPVARSHQGNPLPSSELLWVGRWAWGSHPRNS